MEMMTLAKLAYEKQAFDVPIDRHHFTKDDRDQVLGSYSWSTYSASENRGSCDENTPRKMSIAHSDSSLVFTMLLQLH